MDPRGGNRHRAPLHHGVSREQSLHPFLLSSVCFACPHSLSRFHPPLLPCSSHQQQRTLARCSSTAPATPTYLRHGCAVTRHSPSPQPQPHSGPLVSCGPFFVFLECNAVPQSRTRSLHGEGARGNTLTQLTADMTTNLIPRHVAHPPHALPAAAGV
jgi:hypothetical protein